MYKFIGDSILNASFTVQVPKPLDNRTVVANIYELYSIPPAYAYEGMTVANIDNGNIYMLVNKSKIGEKAGWKASYESIQIIACELNEYKEWKANTNELFQPIDPLKEYLHQDTYYYIYEDSLDGQEELQEYVRRSDWMELLNEVTTNRQQMGQLISAIRAEYTSLEYANNTFAPLTMFDTEDPESFISTLISNYYTKEEADEKFVTIESLQDEDSFIFVTSERYRLDKEAYEEYKQDIAEQLTHFVVTDSDASLNKLVVGQIISPTAGGQRLVIDVTAEGLKVGDKRYAFLDDIPNLITVTKAEYEQLVTNDELIDDAYYYITGEEDSYVLRSELERDYYNINSVKGLVYNWSYSKEVIDQLLADIETGSSEIYFSKEYIREHYVDNEELATALEDYVSIAMIKNNDEYIFVTKSQYQQDQTDRDLLIDSTYVKKDSDASLNSLETSTIKNGANTLTITDILKLNNKRMAFEEDIPVIQVISQEDYEQLEKDPDVFYFVYNTNQNLAFVTAEELENYYTKPQIDSKLVAINQYSDFIKSDLFVQMSIKFNVEKILMERIADNQYYIARVSGNHIDITEYAPDQSILTTTGTGLVSFFRHLITNDTELGNDILTITLTYNDISVTMTESGQSTDNPSTVSIQLVTFLRQITGKATGDIKQSDLNGKILNMRVAKDTVYVDYKVAIKG